MWQRPGDIFGSKKYRRADDAANQQKDTIEQRKAADQRWLRLGSYRYQSRGRSTRHQLSDSQFVWGFEWRAAVATDDGRAIAADERVGYFDGTLGTVKRGGLGFRRRLWV